MIVGLHGRLEARGPDWLQVRAGAFSLQVFVPTSTVAEAGSPGDEVHLHTVLILREDGVTLYGFSTLEAQRLFQALILVNGVGPRHALALLSAMAPPELAAAIIGGNEAALRKAPGIGTKTASRIVLELRQALEREWGAMAAPAEALADDADVVAALGALGYSAQEAKEAAAGIPRDPSLPLEERLRLALQRLGR